MSHVTKMYVGQFASPRFQCAPQGDDEPSMLGASNVGREDGLRPTPIPYQFKHSSYSLLILRAGHRRGRRLGGLCFAQRGQHIVSGCIQSQIH